MSRRVLFVLTALLLLAGVAWRIPGESPPEVRSPSAATHPPSGLKPDGAPAPPASTSPPAPRAHPEVPPADAVDTLLVRDAATKAPLPGARVYGHPRSPNFPSCTCTGDLYPPPACRAKSVAGITGSDGRLSLDLSSLVVHVIAAGHRWGMPERTEDGLVADLPPGSTVNLSINHFRELEEPLLFAEQGDFPAGIDPTDLGSLLLAGLARPGLNPVDAGPHPVSLPLPGSETTVDEGIAAGTWTYFVRRGARDGEIYARGVVTVAEGEVAELRLDAVPVTAGPRFPVKATVLVPKGWGFDSRTGWIQDFDVEVAQDAFIADPEPFVCLKGLDPLNRHLEATASYEKAGADGLFRVLLKPDLPAGRYRAAVGPMGFVTEVEVAGPSPEVRIELPEPGEVRVTLLDSSTGKPVADGWVRWAPAWKGLPRGQLETLSVDKGTGSVALRAPPGTCHVDLGAGGYLDGERSLSFVAGSTAEVKVALRPAAVLVVRVRLDGKPFEGGGWAEAKLRVDSEELERLAAESETGGVVTSMASGFQGGEARIDGLWAGPHEVTVTHIPGFEPVPPRCVEVRFGTETVVEFDLVRAK